MIILFKFNKICSAYCLLYCMIALVYSDYPKEAAASTYQLCTLVPSLNSGANADPAAVQALVLAVVRP